MDLKIINGMLYDPLNGIIGERAELCVSKGKVVEDVKDAKVIDASNMIITPGKVDIHSHIAGPKINVGRKLRPEEHRKEPVAATSLTRSGVGGTLPSTFVTGYKYAAMGYTTVIEPAVPPLKARHVHEELNDTPIIDRGCFILMGNNEYIMSNIGQLDKVESYVRWLLSATKGYAIKAVNPCGSDNWKWGKNVHGLFEKNVNFDVEPKDMILTLAKVSERLKLPHPLHLHMVDLGVPGNFESALETLKILRGKKAHLTHLQYNSYGGTSWKNFSSEGPEIAEKINKDRNLTVDSGQIVFGETTTMTADGPWQYKLHQLSGNKWVNDDVEIECGSGIVPYSYKRKNPVNATQWATGLELLLLIEDPWRVYLTTDSPNGGSFSNYPYLIRLLMDKEFRKEELISLNSRVNKTFLPDIDREYTMEEITVMTSAGPARALGLKNKGHLGVGADADVAIYEMDQDKQKMFSKPAYVIKNGEIVVKDRKIVSQFSGKTFLLDLDSPSPDEETTDFFNKYYSMDIENYPVGMEYLPSYEVVECR